MLGLLSGLGVLSWNPAPSFYDQSAERTVTLKHRVLTEAPKSGAINRRVSDLKERVFGLIPIARPKFIICPPPLGSPRFARGTEKRDRFRPFARGTEKRDRFHRFARGTALTQVRFPLRAGGTSRRGSPHPLTSGYRWR